MKWNDTYITAGAAVLGRCEPVSESVRAGRYDADEAENDGYRSISVIEDGPAVELAVEAARRTLRRASGDSVGLVLHSSCGPQGLDHFAAASYVQAQTVGGSAPAMEVRQYSNGGLAALEMAAAYLSASGGRATGALLCTSDIFALPSFDRFRSDKGVVFGDGGTGLLLGRDGGVAKLLSTCLVSDGTHGAVYIGDQPEETATDGGPIDLRVRRSTYIDRNLELLMQVVESMTAKQTESVQGALTDAGLSASDIDRWVLTNVGLTMADFTFRADVGIPDELTTWEWGRRVGHIGAADQIAGLVHLLETGEVGPGDRVALCGVGLGFTYASAVVEILERPDWTSTAAPDGDR